MTEIDDATAERERQYTPELSVINFEQKFTERAQRSEATRRRWANQLDIRFGPGPKETLDVFPASEPGAPVQIFFHGGYWRRGDKDSCSFLANPFLEQGACVVFPNYDLCPDVTLSELLAQSRRALAWTYENILSFNGDPDRIFVSGGSAGGHITAMAMARDWEADGLPATLIKGATPITGVHDVEKVLQISVNDDIRLTPADISLVSPMENPPRSDCPIVVAVGGAEPEGWKQMSRDYAGLCTRTGLAVTYLEVPGEDHLTITNSMGDASTPLARAMLMQMGLYEG